MNYEGDVHLIVRMLHSVIPESVHKEKPVNLNPCELFVCMYFRVAEMGVKQPGIKDIP
jgi:hypothetical protein